MHLQMCLYECECNMDKQRGEIRRCGNTTVSQDAEWVNSANIIVKSYGHTQWGPKKHSQILIFSFRYNLKWISTKQTSRKKAFKNI